MFTLAISGCCNGCSYSDLVLTKRDFYFTDPAFDLPQYSLRCTHQEVCGALAKEVADHHLAPDFEG